MKIRPLAAELLQADGRTNMKNLIVAFRNFGNAPKSATFRPHVAFTCSVPKQQQFHYWEVPVMLTQCFACDWGTEFLNIMGLTKNM